METVVVTKEIGWESNNVADTRGNHSWQREFLDASRFWGPYVLTPILFVIAVTCNATSIKIFAKKSMLSSTNIYLAALAVSDLFYQVFSFTLSWKYYQIMDTVGIYWWYTPFGLWLTEASRSTSVWIIVVLTVERFIAICNTLNRQVYCTEKRAMYVSSIVFLCSFTFTGSFSYEWRGAIKHVEGNPLNETVYTLESTEAWKEERFQTAYNWISTLYFFLLPNLIILVFSYFILKFVPDNGEGRHLMTRQQDFMVSQRQLQDNMVTMTVVTVSLMYMFCQLPTNLLAMYTLGYDPTSGSTKESVLLELRNIFSLMGRINSACNLLLYALLNGDYYKYLRTMCFRQRVRNYNSNSLRPPRVCWRAGVQPSEGAVEIQNLMDGEY